MTTGWSRLSAQRITAAASGGDPFYIGTHWIMLHHGEPGASGTDNVMNGGARSLVEFGTVVNSPPAAPYVLSDTAGEFFNWQGGSAPPTHASSWSAEIGGDFQVSGIANITSESVPETGGTFVMPPGSIVLSEGIAD